MRRRTLIIGAASYAGSIVGGAVLWRAIGPAEAAGNGWDPGITAFDKVMGADNAPVTMIEYASFTCPHCATFHNDTLPALKEQYIDTGILRLVFRDFPLDGLGLRAGMMARCAPPEQYFNLIGVLFSSQRQWSAAADKIDAIRKIGLLAGIGEADFEACMANDSLANQIIELRQAAQADYDVNSTPTFVLNGEIFSGARPIDEFTDMIDRLAAD